MSFRIHTTLLLTVAAAFCGCRTNPHVASFIENRNAESRLQEDEYWRQVQENERLAYELEKLRRQKVKEGSSDEMSPPTVEEGLSPPEIKIPGTSPESPKPNKPEIEPEPPPEMPGDLPAPRGAGASHPTEVIDRKVTHLFLNPLHTGGIEFDRRPGDDGLSLLLEPRNAENQFVPLAGKVSVVLLDPQRSGDAARVARWTFGSQETAQSIRQDDEVQGIQLAMPWPSRPPENGQLRMFVRYETADGRKIQSEREVFIKLPGQVSERWTPRPPQRQRRNALVQSNDPQESERTADLQQDSSARAAQHSIGGPASEIASTSAEIPTPAATASPPAAPPPALGEAAENAASARPRWKPYR